VTKLLDIMQKGYKKKKVLSRYFLSLMIQKDNANNKITTVVVNSGRRHFGGRQKGKSFEGTGMSVCMYSSWQNSIYKTDSSW